MGHSIFTLSVIITTILVVYGKVIESEYDHEDDFVKQLMPESRGTPFYAIYPVIKAAQLSKKNNVPVKKRLSLKIKRNSWLKSNNYVFWGKETYQYNVLSCPTFDLPCTQGYIILKIGSYVQKFCGVNKPWHAAAKGQYFTVNYKTFPGITLNREIKCFVTGVTGKVGKKLTQVPVTPYCSSPTTPAPATYGTELNCVCGVEPFTTYGRSGEQSKIFGGVTSAANAFPWTVLIHFASSTPADEFHCAGAILSDQWIVTAASCVYMKSLSDLAVSVGNHVLFLTSTGTSIPIIESYDLGYDAFNHKNDIILLKLGSTLDLVNDPKLKPLCLPSPCDSFDTDTGKVAGWGHTAGLALPSELHSADVTILDNDSCNTSWSGVITSDMLCAGDSSASACVTDLGAPLWVRMYNDQNVLAGVHSYADGCGVTLPGIYTRITEFLSEIRTAIAGTGVCQSYLM